MLAKDVTDNACILDTRVAFECFASKLAPAGNCGSLSLQRVDCRITSATRVFGNTGPTIKADEDS
ncbi:hypothetical protein FHP26_12875 [Pseudomonas orientalis]|nr:hypothetical protein [Pseudomonas orientalis]